YTWPDSTYVREPSFFQGMDAEPAPVEPIEGARVLALLGDSVTTDHISPAGAIKKDSPPRQWLIDQGVEGPCFNPYGSPAGPPPPPPATHHSGARGGAPPPATSPTARRPRSTRRR